MSTSQRIYAYEAAKVRVSALAAAVCSIEAAIGCVQSYDDTGAKFRISEMLERCRDEVGQAEAALERAAKAL